MHQTNQKVVSTARFSCITGAYWASCVPVVAFASVYLLSRGFTNSQIGLILCTGYVLSSLLQPVVGAYADRSKKMILRRVIVQLSLLLILLCGGLLAFSSSFWVTALLYSLLIAFHQMITPFIYSIGIFFINRGVPINFGIARGLGSVAYAGVSALLGTLTANNPNLTLWADILLLALLAASVALFRFSGVNEESASYKNAKVKNGSLLAFARSHRRFSLMLAGNTLVFIGFCSLGSYMLQILQSIGCGSPEMGNVNALGALLELIPLCLLTQMNHRFSSGFLIKISVVAIAAKCLVMLLSTNLTGIYAATCLQLAGYGIFSGISVYYVNHMVETENAVLGQVLMNATTVIANVLSSLICGWILDISGVKMMLAFSTICAIAGAVLVCLTAGKGRKLEARES